MGVTANSPRARPTDPGGVVPRATVELRSLLAPRRIGLAEALALGLLLLAVVATTAWALRVPMFLGHDESVYAVLARHWLEDTPSTGVSPHRAPLLPSLGVLVLAIGGSDTALQAIGAGWAVIATVGVWWLGRSIQGPVAGLLAATVFVFSPTTFDAATTYLTDLPAAAVLVTLAGLLWSQFEVRPSPGPALLFAAPLAAGAYYLRYGSALVVIILTAVAAVLWWNRIRQHPRLVGATSGLLLLLLAPHLVNSTLALGTPWARVLYTSEVAGRDYFGQGLVEYVGWFPQELAGIHAAVLMSVGLLGSLAMWRMTRRRRDDAHVNARDADPLHGSHAVGRGLTFVVVAGLAHLVAIGIASHGDPRFVFFSVALLCVAGAAVTTWALRSLASRSVSTVGVALMVIVGGLGVHVAQLAPSQAGDRAATAERDAVLVDAASGLAERGGTGCAVLTSYVPQVTWYSRCTAHTFGAPPQTGAEGRVGDDGWMLLFEDGKRQPEGDVLTYYLDRFSEVDRWDSERQGLLGHAILYRSEAATS